MPVRNGMHHVAANVHSLKDTVAFYEALGCCLKHAWTAEAPEACMVDVGGTCIEFFEKDEGDPEADAVIVHFALRSEDVDGDFAAALAAGAKVQTEPKDVVLPSNPPLPARIAFVVGINGEIIEFFQEK